LEIELEIQFSTTNKASDLSPFSRQLQPFILLDLKQFYQRKQK